MHLPKRLPPATDADSSGPGLGTLLRRAFNKAGVPACAGCKARERILNDWIPIPALTKKSNPDQRGQS